MPQITRADLPVMLKVAAVGGLIAGVYGILHDQVTYAISPEFFTRLKFAQFWYANFGLGDSVFVGTIGFLATWWAGFAAAWFMARRFIPGQSWSQASRPIIRGCAMVLVAALLFALLGYAYGDWVGRGSMESWSGLLRQLNVKDRAAFVRVAYVHYGGYCGCLVGLVIALVQSRRAELAPDESAATH